MGFGQINPHRAPHLLRCGGQGSTGGVPALRRARDTEKVSPTSKGRCASGSRPGDFSLE